MSNWTSMSLREAGVRLIDCDHRTPPAAESGYPYVAIPQMKEGRIDLSDVRRISEEHYIEWTKKVKPQADDVVLSRRCNPGETAHVPHGLDFALGQNLVLLRADGSKIVPQFLRWLLRGPEWWEQVQKFINVGAVFDSLKCADIPKFVLPLPGLQEQRAIARILGTLDDKIELNRRMNATLEATARALFKSWFVDFDPVLAKAAGRQPAGMDAATAALFPDSFQESELGEIPAEWGASAIGAEARVVGGSTPSTKNSEFWDGGEIHWVSPKDFSSLQSKVLINSSRKITGAGLRQITSGLLPENTVLLSSRAPVGYLALTKIETAINQGFIAMVCDGRLPPEYVMLWADSIMDKIKQAASGTTFAEISKATFRPFRILVPSTGALEAFTRIVRPLFQMVTGNEHQSVALAGVRDELLPRLLSGEIGVKDIANAE
jgi:type I restriction enzyme, S subunit